MTQRVQVQGEAFAGFPVGQFDVPQSESLRRSTRHVTRSEEISGLIADEIVQGRLLPGTPLDEITLARRFGVSRTPIREAIRQLASSGLIERRSHRSATVALPTLQQVYGIFEVLSELESLCAGFAAVRMTAPERRELQNRHDELSEIVRLGDPAYYHEANMQFHDMIYAGSHNDYLAELTRAARVRIAPFSHAQFHALGRLASSHAEHEQVVTAIMRGDHAGASLTMRSHIATVEIAYERYAESR